MAEPLAVEGGSRELVMPPVLGGVQRSGLMSGLLTPKPTFEETMNHQDIERQTKHQALFNLISSVVGAGIMALPKTVSEVGWLPGLGILCLVTVVSTVSCHLVHRAMLMNPAARCAEDLALNAFGPGMRKVVLLFNNGDLFATCVILLVGGGDAASIIMSRFLPADAAQFYSIIGVFVIVAALSLPKDLSGLSKAAFAGVVTLAGYVVVYLADGLTRLFSDPSGDQVLSNLSPGRLAGAASIMGFSYSCAILMPAMHSEMDKVEELPWVINIGHGIVFLIYGSMAVVGYAAYGAEGLDTGDQPLISSASTIPYAAEICSLCILVTIMVGYPLFMNPMVVYIQQLLPSSERGELPTRLVVRLGMATLTLISALSIPYFYEIVLLTGAVSANLMCVILPAVYYLKSAQNEAREGNLANAPTTAIKVAIAVALLQGVVVMSTGVYFGVLDLQEAIEQR